MDYTPEEVDAIVTQRDTLQAQVDAFAEERQRLNDRIQEQSNVIKQLIKNDPAEDETPMSEMDKEIEKINSRRNFNNVT